MNSQLSVTLRSLNISTHLEMQDVQVEWDELECAKPQAFAELTAGSTDVADADPDALALFATVIGNAVFGNEVVSRDVRGQRRAYYRRVLRNNKRIVDVRYAEPREGSPPVTLLVTFVHECGDPVTFDLGRAIGITVAMPVGVILKAIEQGLFPQFRLSEPVPPGELAPLCRPAVLAARDDDSAVSPYIYVQAACNLLSTIAKSGRTVAATFSPGSHGRLPAEPFDPAKVLLLVRPGLEGQVLPNLYRHVGSLIELPVNYRWRREFTSGWLPQWRGRPPRIAFQCQSDDSARLSAAVLGTAVRHVGQSAEDEGHDMFAADFANLFVATGQPGVTWPRGPEDYRDAPTDDSVRPVTAEEKDRLLAALNRLLRARRHGEAGERRLRPAA